MKHPNRNEWVPYVYGEAAPETVETLNQHLAECADCRAQVEGWRRTLKRLDAWDVPARRSRSAMTAPLIKWAAAAAIVLGIGFGLGRFLSPGPDATAIARMENAIKASLAASIEEQIRQGVVAELQRGQAQFASLKALSELEARLAAAGKAESAQLMAEVSTILQAQQEEDREMTETLLAKLQDAHAKDYLNLRTDLETVASVADEQLQDTQFKLVQLASAGRFNE